MLNRIRRTQKPIKEIMILSTSLKTYQKTKQTSISD